MATLIKKVSADELIHKETAAHARRLGGAKGRARQAATRAAKAAKARADLERSDRAVRATSQIVEEIERIQARIDKARPVANNPRGGKWAQRANRDITRMLVRLKELRAEHLHFARQL